MCVVVGFTGTQKGMSLSQCSMVRGILETLMPLQYVRHGDCIGADAQFHEIVESLGVPALIHPSNIPEKRAWCNGEHIYEMEPPLTRNRAIVEGSDALIAAPNQSHEILRSGTWATIRYARKLGRTIYLISP